MRATADGYHPEQLRRAMELQRGRRGGRECRTVERKRDTVRGHTVVPLVPPQHRPRRTRLHLFHVLWEVEKWDPTPPVDPALLRHIRGDLWSVVATWDLTELERAVLSARVG